METGGRGKPMTEERSTLLGKNWNKIFTLGWSCFNMKDKKSQLSTYSSGVVRRATETMFVLHINGSWLIQMLPEVFWVEATWAAFNATNVVDTDWRILCRSSFQILSSSVWLERDHQGLKSGFWQRFSLFWIRFLDILLLENTPQHDATTTVLHCGDGVWAWFPLDVTPEEFELRPNESFSKKD